MDYSRFQKVFEKFGYRQQSRNIFYKHSNSELQGFIFEELDHKTTLRICCFKVPYLFEYKLKKRFTQIEVFQLKEYGLQTALELFYEMGNNHLKESDVAQINDEFEQKILPFFERFSIANQLFWERFFDIDIKGEEDFKDYSNDEIFHGALLEIKYHNNYPKAKKYFNILNKYATKIEEREKELYLLLKEWPCEKSVSLINKIIDKTEKKFLINNKKFK